MPAIRVTWKGKAELVRRFQRMAPQAVEELGKNSLAMGNEMVSMARRLAPRRSGALQASIVLTPPGQVPPKHSQGVRVGSVMVTAGNDAVRYAHLVEFGVAPFTSGGMFEGVVNPGVPPHPFFFPAYRVVRRMFKRMASKALKKSIKDAGK